MCGIRFEMQWTTQIIEKVTLTRGSCGMRSQPRIEERIYISDGVHESPKNVSSCRAASPLTCFVDMLKQFYRTVCEFIWVNCVT
jgi:hypothetical protein